MITLLHGDDTNASRTELQRLVTSAKGKEIRELNGRSVDMTLLTQALESTSLFGDERVVVIENLFAKLGRKTKLIEDLARIIERSAKSTDIILWEDGIVGTTVLKALPNAQVKLFKLPVLLFQFLDGLRPRAAGILLPQLKLLTAHEPAEIVYTLLVRRVRQLIQLTDHVTPAGVSPWQLSRLTAQARLFTMDELVQMHTSLTDMDIAIKTGTTPFTLAKLLELLLIHS